MKDRLGLPFIVRTFLLSLVLCGAACAQQVPIVLIDGYHLTCSTTSSNSSGYFGQLEASLKTQAFDVHYFEVCSVPGKPPIEELGAALGRFITGLNVPQVDVVTHSMGGLVLRSYLAGKSTTQGVFNPPADPHVRKWVSLATPNFGILFSDLLSILAPDDQARELTSNQFYFDLATWNQNNDDLRGIDALGLAGDAGSNVSGLSNTDDGLVPVTSASLKFALPDDHTRVLPVCHTTDSTLKILGQCSSPAIAVITSTNDPVYRAIRSFLSGTDEWRTIGTPPSADPILSKYGGLLTETRDASDKIGSNDNKPFVATAPPGRYTAVISKPGPLIALIAPAAGRVTTLDLAAHEIVSIYGSNLDGASVVVNSQSLPILYTGSHQINAILPDGLTGLNKVTVMSAAGKNSVNILIDTAVPAIFTADGSGTGPAAVIRTGQYESLFVTGLGSVTNPQVSIDGMNATVTYAGPAPGFPGLDQINVLIPGAARTGTPVPLQISAGGRLSNTATLTL